MAKQYISALILMLTMAVPICSRGEGYEPDPVEYQKALDAVVSASCKKFEGYGVHVDQKRIKYGDHEVIDSFLQGREYYRDAYNNRHPMTEKMTWLKELFGDTFNDLEQKWRLKVDERNNGPLKILTQEEIRKRLNALRDAPAAPVKHDDGLCRSSSGGMPVEVECIHCGKPTVYRYLDMYYHRLSPKACVNYAKELLMWGIPAEVDGRAVCSECNSTYDFKMSDFPMEVKVRDDIDFSKNSHLRQYIKPGLIMQVQEVHPTQYRVSCTYAEAWMRIAGDDYVLYMSPDVEAYNCIYKKCIQLHYAEPREEIDVPGKGRLVKVVNVPGARSILVPKEMVDVSKSVRASGLYDIPATTMYVNGHKFEASERAIAALLAFAQGYDTVITGPFCDHWPLKNSEPWLRSILLNADSVQPNTNNISLKE